MRGVLVTDVTSGSMRRVLVVVLAATLALLPAVGAAWADPRDDLRDNKRELAEAHEDLDQSTEELAEATAAYKKAMAKLPGARDRLTTARGAVSSAEAALQQAEAELDTAQAADIAAAAKLAHAKRKVELQESKIADITLQIDGKRQSISQLAVSAYQTGAGSELALITSAFKADSLTSVASELTANQAVIASQGSVLAGMQDDRARLANERVVLEGLRDEAKRLREEAARKLEETEQREIAAQAARDQAAQAAQAAEAAKAQVDDLVSARESAMASADAAKSADAQAYADLEAERDRIQDEIDRLQDGDDSSGGSSGSDSGSGGGSSGGGSGGGSSASSGLAWPVSSPYVTSPYGMRVHPITGVYKLHDGTDFRAYCGTPIYAANSGSVAWASYQGAYGNQVAINGSGYVSTYSHLSSYAVGAGQWVSQGQLVGYAGTTGSSTACHLHFMLYVNGALVDPMSSL